LKQKVDVRQLVIVRMSHLLLTYVKNKYDLIF